jgi:hypothetical protein
MLLFSYKSTLVLAALLPASVASVGIDCREYILNGDFEEQSGVEGEVPPLWTLESEPGGENATCSISLHKGNINVGPIAVPDPINGWDALATQNPAFSSNCTLYQEIMSVPSVFTNATLRFSWRQTTTTNQQAGSQEATAAVCIQNGNDIVPIFTTVGEALFSNETQTETIDIGSNIMAAVTAGTTSKLRFDVLANNGALPFQFDDVSVVICVEDPGQGPPGGCENPGGCADPHFTTWSDEHFDFQGECDLVMVDNPDFKNGLGMYIHARTTLHGTWSAISSAVIKIGSDILEVHGEDLPMINDIEFPLDVEDGDEFAFPVFMGGYSLTVQQRGPHSRRFIIHLGEGERIFINNFKEFVDVEIESPRAEEFTGSVGLLGSYTTGSKLSRDGKTIIEDPDAFGQEWQVHDTDPQLFSVIDGPQYPAKCNMPEELSAEQRRLRNLTRKVSPEDAEKACAKVKSHFKFNCVADVLAADNLDLAGVYTGGSL